jgi:hypothetical protein
MRAARWRFPSIQLHVFMDLQIHSEEPGQDFFQSVLSVQAIRLSTNDGESDGSDLGLD